MLEVGGTGNGVSRDLIRASRALKGPVFFNFRGFSWSLLLDQSTRASEAWSFCASHLYLQTEIIFLNKLLNPLGIEILEL